MSNIRLCALMMTVILFRKVLSARQGFCEGKNAVRLAGLHVQQSRPPAPKTHQ